MKLVNIYTDGACSGNQNENNIGGWGAVLEFAGHEKELHGGEVNTTNNRMELTGVISALSALNQPCVVELFTDSRYIVDAVEKRWVYAWQSRGWMRNRREPALNPDLWQALLTLLERHEVHFHWVQGHAENEKNNRCDALAVMQREKYQK